MKTNNGSNNDQAPATDARNPMKSKPLKSGEGTSTTLNATMWWIVGGAICLIVLLGIVIKKLPGKQPERPKEKPVAVTVMEIQGQPVRDTIILPGRIKSEADIIVASDKAGRVIELKADKGDRVKSGALLLRIDDKAWRAARDRALIENRAAASELERYQQLLKTGGVSENDFARIRQRAGMARVALENAEGQLKDCRVNSPISGVVESRFIDLGERAGEGANVFRIVDARIVKIAFDVPEKDITSVKPGMEVPFSVTAYPDALFNGKVTFVALAAQDVNNAYKVELTTGNADGRLRPGMIADVSLLRRALDSAVLVPLASIIPHKGDHIVYVVEGDRVERRAVKIDFFVGNNVVLGEGIQPGERMVIEGQRMLMDGSLIKEVAPSPDTLPDTEE